MRWLVSRVFKIITLTNPFVRSTVSPNELINLIVEHSDKYLKMFGLPLCEWIATPIINLECNPFDRKSNYFSFFELCKKEHNKIEAARQLEKTNRLNEELALRRIEETKKLQDKVELVDSMQPESVDRDRKKTIREIMAEIKKRGAQ